VTTPSPKPRRRDTLENKVDSRLFPHPKFFY
jgi:hypothetical protein